MVVLGEDRRSVDRRFQAAPQAQLSGHDDRKRPRERLTDASVRVEPKRGIFGPRWHPACEPARIKSLRIGEYVFVAVTFAHEYAQPPSRGDRVALDCDRALRLPEQKLALGQANRLGDHPGRRLVVDAGLTYPIAPLGMMRQTVNEPRDKPSDIVPRRVEQMDEIAHHYRVVDRFGQPLCEHAQSARGQLVRMQRSLTNDRELLDQVLWVRPFREQRVVAREELD